MEIKLPLLMPSFSDDRMIEEIKKDFKESCQIYIYKDEDNWKDDEKYNAFSLLVEYGKDNKETLMFDVDLNDLEMFANSLMKSIEMLRRDYSEVIKHKINNGSPI